MGFFDCARLAAMAVALSAAGATAQGLTVPLHDIVQDVPVSGTILLRDVRRTDGGRCEADIRLSLPILWSDLDRIGRAEGNIGSSRNRLYWTGPTSMRGVDGNRIRLRSRARYESWTYIRVFGETIKTRNFRDTKTVDLSLRLGWDAASRTLSLRYGIDNIRNVPGSLEDLLRSLGVKFGGTTVLPLPEHEAVERYAPWIEAGPTFRAPDDGDGLEIDLTVSADLDWLRCQALIVVGVAPQESLDTLRGVLAELMRD